MKPKPKPRTFEQPLIATMRLDLALDMNHELVRLAAVVPWEQLAADFGPLYCTDNGRPAVPIRLMAGLHYLKHIKAVSDDQIVRTWVENPYMQFFCGEEFFQHRLPIDPSQMSRWRQRIGPDGVEKLLQATITAGLKAGVITTTSADKVIVDTTVQPKAVKYPTDARLYRKVHAAMLRIASFTAGFLARFLYFQLPGHMASCLHSFLAKPSPMRATGGPGRHSHPYPVQACQRTICHCGYK